MKSTPASTIVATILLFATAAAVAGPQPSDTRIGQPGAGHAVDRTIEVRMGDMFFEPKSIEVKAGQTIRFIVQNDGALQHEFNLGTAAAHAEHQKEMAAMSHGGGHDMGNMDHSMPGMNMTGMTHGGANVVTVDPGARKELLWTFAAATDLEFACNVPGHYQAGMVGKLSVR